MKRICFLFLAILSTSSFAYMDDQFFYEREYNSRNEDTTIYYCKTRKIVNNGWIWPDPKEAWVEQTGIADNEGCYKKALELAKNPENESSVYYQWKVRARGYVNAKSSATYKSGDRRVRPAPKVNASEVYFEAHKPKF